MLSPRRNPLPGGVDTHHLENMTFTSFEFVEQWLNQTDVTTALMIIGGDVVQKALTQTAGCLYISVCFSSWAAVAETAGTDLPRQQVKLSDPYSIMMFIHHRRIGWRC